MELSKVSTEELIEELRKRNGVRDTKVKETESYKIVAAGTVDGKNNRFIQVPGPAVVLAVDIKGQ